MQANSGLMMLLKQAGLNVPELIQQFEMVKREIPKFAQDVKRTVETTQADIAALRSSMLDLHMKLDRVIELLQADPLVHPAGPSRVPAGDDYSNGAAL